MIEMTRRENLIINMPHPRAEGIDRLSRRRQGHAFQRTETYEGVGYRWGMGIDGSEKRLCEYRCQALFDEMNNWVRRPADRRSSTCRRISESRSASASRATVDDAPTPTDRSTTSSSIALPTVDDMSPIINAMKRGDYFVTSGEVLISNYAVEGSGRQADDRSGGRVDVSAGLRRGGLGRRAEDRSADHLDNRSAAVRQEAVPDPVQRGGEEVGAVCRLGRRRATAPSFSP